MKFNMSPDKMSVCTPSQDMCDEYQSTSPLAPNKTYSYTMKLQEVSHEEGMEYEEVWEIFFANQFLNGFLGEKELLNLEAVCKTFQNFNTDFLLFKHLGMPKFRGIEL